jgi:hypothetical protein
VKSGPKERAFSIAGDELPGATQTTQNQKAQDFVANFLPVGGRHCACFTRIQTNSLWKNPDLEQIGLNAPAPLAANVHRCSRWNERIKGINNDASICRKTAPDPEFLKPPVSP